MDKKSSASKAESSSAGRGNPEDARSAGGHKDKDDNKAPQRSSTSGHPHVKGKDDPKAPQSSSTSGLRPPVLSPIQSILNEAMSEAGVEEITGDMLDSQIDHISKLIQQIKAEQKHDKPSSLVRKINTSFSKRMTATNSVWKVWFQKCPQIGEIRTMAADLLGSLGTSQSCFAGLLIVAHVLRKFGVISGNRVECLELLKDINVLATMVIRLREQVTLSWNTEAGAIQESRQLILQGSILCCTILEESKDSMFSKLFKASPNTNKDQLTQLRREVDRNYKQLIAELAIENLKAVRPPEVPDSKDVRRPREMQDFSPDHAVGIEEQLKTVIGHLGWESKTKTVAVIVYGLAGMGKTTLAEAAYSKILQENYNCSKNICKYSKIRLCEETDSSSDIKSLQTFIREDLVGDDYKKLEVIRDFEHGRQEIGDILRKESVFLYIDNVLSKERLADLLPSLDQAKKLRLLITARDKGICTVLGPNISCKFHEVVAISKPHAEELLTKHMGCTQNIGKRAMLDIVETAKGVPLILRVIGQFFGAAEDKEEAYRIFREERENWSGQIFDGLDIVYKYMPDDLKDPFLDICSFFHNEWYWEAVGDIVGISVLNMLQKRGLFTKDRQSTVTVHDIILRIGLPKSKGSRIMHPNEISQLDRKVIKGFWFKKDQGLEPILAIKLDQIASSLRILSLQNLKVEGNYNENFPELIYLDAGMNPLPSNVSAFKKLRYLSYSPQKPEDLNLSQMPDEMRRLKLNGMLYSSLFRSCSLDLHGLRLLRVLKLHEFKHLRKLPKEFAFLKCLEVLHIMDCDGFEELFTDVSDLKEEVELKEMASLTIERCPNLRKLPKLISKLKLQSLRLPHCAGLSRLPRDFGSLSSLRNLDLKGTGLKMLPSSFAQLSSLLWLCLSSCDKLEDLSKDFHSLPSLQYLELSSCPTLQGECMDMIKEVKTLKVVDIRKSQKLLQKWQGLTDPPTNFSVKMK